MSIDDLTIRCCICGRDLPVTETQIAVCTKGKGIESVCLCHEFSDALKQYVAAHGGPDRFESHLHRGENDADVHR